MIQMSTFYFLHQLFGLLRLCIGIVLKHLHYYLGIFGTIALIIFGALGDGRDFMPDWEHNYLSWSFGLAFVGAVFDYVAGVLFLVEARIMRRKEIARDKQYPMEQRV